MSTNHTPDQPEDDEIAERLREYAQQHLADVRAPADLWQRLAPQLGPQDAPPWWRRPWRAGAPARWPLLRLAAPALALVLVTLVWALARPVPVGAQAVVARARGALASQSFWGTLRFVSQALPERPFRVEQHIWFQAPNARRIESTEVLPGLEGPAGPIQDMLVSDGATVWEYVVPQQQVIVRQAWDMRHGATAFGAASLETLLQAAQQDYTVRLDGVAQVAGRACHRLELTARPGSTAARAAQVILWVDVATYVVLGEETRDGTGRWLERWSYTTIAYDTSIDPATFTFQIPPGATVARVPPLFPATAAALERDWQQVARAAPFAVFRPDYLPAGLMAQTPAYDVSRGVTQGYAAADRSMVLALHQGPAGAGAAPPDADAVELEIGRAWYRQQDDQQVLIIDLAGTRLTFQASGQVAKDDLLQIVRSLRRL